MPRALQPQLSVQQTVSGRWVKAVLLGRRCLNGPLFTFISFIEIGSAAADMTMDQVVSEIFSHAAKDSTIPHDLLEGFEFRFVNAHQVPTPN